MNKNKKPFPHRLALMALSALLLGLGASAPASAAGSDRELDAMVISASRSQARLEEMPLHTTLITAEEIRQSPAQSVDQLLRAVPGLNFTGVPASQSDPTGHQARMRGMGNAKVLVLLDGVPIHDPFYLTTQWFKVPLSDIERIEIVRGGNSSLWGNMATAGLINIVSRRAADNSGEALASFGSHGSRNLAASRNLLLSPALSFTLAFDQFETDGYQTTPADQLWRFPAKQPVAARNTNVRFSAYFQPAPDLRGLLRLGYHVQDQDISYRYGRNRQTSPDLAASLSKDFDAGTSLTANAWAQTVKFEKYNGASCYWQATGTRCPSSAATTPASINGDIVQYFSQHGSLHYREQGGALVYAKTLGLPWNSLQLGLDERQLSADDAELFYSPPTALSELQKLNSGTHGIGRQRFNAAFGQTRIVPFDSLELTLSGRHDAWRNSGRNNVRTSAAGIVSGGTLADSSSSAFSPGLGARYDLSEQLNLRAAAYKAFRAPGFNNTTRTYGTGTGIVIANPDLVPERLKGWEVGGDYRSGGLSLAASYFRYDIENMIATYTVKAAATNIPPLVTAICGTVAGGGFSNCGGASTTSVSFYTNDQDGQSHGLELTGRWKWQEHLWLDASFTHTETYLTRRGAIVTDPLGVQLVAVPRNVAALAATWNRADGFKAAAEARYIGPMLIDTTSVAGARFGQGGATVVNASASHAWDRRSEIFLSAVNLFDKRYSENGYKYDQPYNRTLSMPRSLVLGVRLGF